MRRDFLTPTIVIGGIVIVIMFLWIVIAEGQTTKTPINNGILQSDLNAAGFKINNANMVDYAGLNMTWNPTTKRFDASGGGVGGGTGTVTSITATTPIVVTPSPLVATGVISLDGTSKTNWDTAYTDRNKWDGGATGLTAATGRTSLGLEIGTNVQAYDADLTSLAGASGTNTIYYRSAANTWSAVTIGGNMTFSGGTLNSTSGGSGTVTDFSAGDLSPLFTTTEATTTTTPALSFSLTSAAATTVFGRAAGTSGAPTFSASPQFTAIGNLTSNGFVKTSGSVGTLSVDTATYLTANQNISLTGEVTGGPAATSIATTIADGITVANWTLTTPTIAAISNLTTNGFVKTGGGIGTLSVDTATYQASDADLTTWAGITPGTNVGTFLATPSSANLAAAVTGETGSGALVFGTSPDFTTGVTIGSVAIPTISSTSTFTNKRVSPRVTTITSNATLSPSADNEDIYAVSALATAVTTISAPTGTPVDGQKLIIRVISDSSVRAISGWNAIYRFSTANPAPSTTVASTTHTWGFMYNATAVKWDCLAIASNP